MSNDREKDVFPFPEGVSLPPVHPGRTLAAELGARGLTAGALALKLRVHPNRLSEIVREHRGISPETALRLGRYFGTGAAFWGKPSGAVRSCTGGTGTGSADRQGS